MEIEELQQKIFNELKSVAIDYTYWNSYNMTQGVFNRYFLTKKTMEEIFKNIELKENTKNFLDQCYKVMHLNHCNNEKEIVTITKYIDFQDINTILCIEYGKEYIDIMKMPGE